MAIDIGRRKFIAALGGATFAGPFAARAQQPEKMRRIGVMMANPENSRDGRQQADALREGLQELGWTDGRTVRIDFHWDVSEPGRAQTIAKDIVAVQPDLIVSHAISATTAIFQLTKTIPIVFVNVADPVALGLVSSYALPGGNATGFSNFESSMGGKWLEVLKDLDPRIRRVAILFNPQTAVGGGTFYLPSFNTAAAALGVEPIEARVHDSAGIEKAIDALAREPNGGLVAMADIFTNLNRELIIRLAAKGHLPFIAAFRSFTDDGGLVSYGSSAIDIFHRAASYVDRILKGEKPADLPVQAPTKFELVINLKTAKALGLTVPQIMQMTADEVIE
jgi:putative tryptophan/tyrosine transport system substrate-binding protein